MCRACIEAFSLARNAHPAGGRLGAAAADDTDILVYADIEFWDACALLGDAGTHPRGPGEH